MIGNTLTVGDETTLLARALSFGDDLSTTAARALLKLRITEAEQRRIAELSAKARAGTLTELEEQQAEAYERLGCLLDVIHSLARSALKRHRKAS